MARSCATAPPEAVIGDFDGKLRNCGGKGYRLGRDGDDFWVNISSDLIEGPIIENGTTDYWYNDELPAGVHNLSFNLTDSTGLTRIHNQILHVNPTAPHAIISSLTEGLYITPGEAIIFDGSQSWDADEEIIE